MRRSLCFLLLILACALALFACDGHVHDYGEWTTVKAATCTEEGEQERACSCGEKQTKSIRATGHTEVIDAAIDATCTEGGRTEGKHCSTCEQILVPAQDVGAKGHTVKTEPAVDATCTEGGWTEGRHCTACGQVLAIRQKTSAKGHERVTNKQIPPTCDSEGMSGGESCSRCNKTLSEPEAIPAKGYNWILEDGEFKLLMIGNSFTQDASNYASSQSIKSQLFDILQAMLGDDVKITIGILFAGDRGLNWHATQAYNNNAACHLQVYTTKNPYWVDYGECTHANALEWTDWDFVSLQPYGVKTDTGIESNNFPAETHLKFFNIADSSAYLLDLVHNNAPQAEVYCYMHWVNTTEIALNAGLEKYKQMAAFYPSLLECRGTETGKRFTSIVPVGLSIQNARTSYLALLSYNASAYLDKTLSYQTDGQLGLQRDQGHLSYNVGRYIAALTFAEMLIPESLRAENYTIPSIRRTESIGDLPKEYSLIAQMAVTEAVEAWREGKLSSVADLSAYAKDPTTRFAENFKDGLTLKSSYNVDTIERTVTDSITNAQGARNLVIESIEFPDPVTPGRDFKVSVTVRFGYTTLVFEVDCTF